MFGPEVIKNLILQYGYWAMFIGMVFEGPFITIISGFLTSLGYFNFLYVYIIITIADVIGDILAYGLGYFGRSKVLVKIFNILEIPEEKLLGFDVFFQKHGGKSVFISKFIAGAGSWVLISSGIGRMNFKRFLFYSITSAIIKSFVYVGAGYLFGSLYLVLFKWMNITGSIVTVILLIIVIFWIYKNYSRKYIAKMLNQKTGKKSKKKGSKKSKKKAFKKQRQNKKSSKK